MEKKSKKLVANNKKVRSDYFTLETSETGIELFGTEVKVLRMGHYSVEESWVGIRNREILIYRMHINPYEKGDILGKDSLCVRRLLMYKSGVHRLIGTIKEKGLTLVSLEVYLKGRLVKAETGLAQGKEEYDKHAAITKNGARRGLERSFKRSTRY